MASLESVRNLIDEAKGILLVVMQEADDEPEPTLFEEAWAYEASRGYELLTEASQAVGRAQL